MQLVDRVGVLLASRRRFEQKGSSRSSRWRQYSLREVERMFGLMASNVFCGNRDDHLKNVAFIGKAAVDAFGRILRYR